MPKFRVEGSGMKWYAGAGDIEAKDAEEAQDIFEEDFFRESDEIDYEISIFAVEQLPED